MNAASTTRNMSPELQRIAERAKREPEGKFHALAHLMDEQLLAGAYRRIRKDAAVGVDGITKEQYGQDLQERLRDLHARMVAKKYRHQPIRRVHIPKDSGKTRPIGISTIEDKVVQNALSEVLGAIYEQDFRDCSYGFRPGRSAHDAVRALTAVVDRGGANFILEIDLASYFDSINRKMLMEWLQKRVADGSILRLISKCMHVGVLDGEEMTSPEEGTAQGSTLSPLLGNVYLHYVLDVWFAEEVRPRLKGKATLVRYADDAVFGFERQDDAERVKTVLEQRLAEFGLRLNLDKTRLLDFRSPPRAQGEGKGRGTFDFLGFTWYWRRSRKGKWVVACKTRGARRARFLTAVYDWCRSHLHQPVKVQHAALVRRLQGHFNYYGVNGNVNCLSAVRVAVQRVWFKWLNRRSQRARLTWERFEDLLRDFPLPEPRITVSIWKGAG